MQSKSSIINTSQVWNSKKRYKINETVSHFGIVYQNATGINTNPTLGIDWNVQYTSNQIDLSDFGVYANDSAAEIGGIQLGYGYINSVTGALTKRLI